MQWQNPEQNWNFICHNLVVYLLRIVASTICSMKIWSNGIKILEITQRKTIDMLKKNPTKYIWNFFFSEWNGNTKWFIQVWLPHSTLLVFPKTISDLHSCMCCQYWQTWILTMGKKQTINKTKTTQQQQKNTHKTPTNQNKAKQKPKIKKTNLNFLDWLHLL